MNQTYKNQTNETDVYVRQFNSTINSVIPLNENNSLKPILRNNNLMSLNDY